MWEQTWAVPGEDITLGVADVLPAGVAVNASGTHFVATVAGTTLVLSLAEMCSACAAADGTTVVKPAFSHTVTTTTTLPAELVSATLTGDQFALELAHDFNFDPLRPDPAAGAERGYIVLEITSGGTQVARDSISGDDVAFDSTVVLTPVLETMPGEISGTLDVEVRVYSPAGEPVEMDASDALSIEVQPAEITMSEATVQAGSITIDAVAAELELDVDSALVSRIRSGALRLDVVNPFELEGTLQLDFDLGSRSIAKSVALVSGTSTVDVSFTAAELQDLLGAGDVSVSAAGTVSAPGGTLTVQPTDTLVMESLFELVILVGGTEEEG